METVLYYIWLSLRSGAGSEAPSFLLSHFGSPKDIYEADESTLSSVLPNRPGIVAALCDKNMEMPKKVLEYCQRANVGIITLESPAYPERLRSIHAKPIVLYYKGRLPEIDDRVLISCVGTRNCSDKGAKLAYQLGADLAKCGVIVVSGMALGIDTMCARGALSAKGHTIAVLGCGIDRVYPRENEALMMDIIEKGTVITEYAPGMSPNGKHFPVRNRIISGLSLGTVIVESGRSGGSLITADHARKQGRDVFAFPGDVDNPYYEGNNGLIADGAHMVRSAADVLSEYKDLWHKRIFIDNIYKNKSFSNSKKRTEKNMHSEAMPCETPAENVIVPFEQKPKKRPGRPKKSEKELAVIEETPELKTATERDYSELGGLEKIICRSLQAEMNIDEITAEVCKISGGAVSPGEILSALTSLEIDGYCESLPGGLFKKLQN